MQASGTSGTNGISKETYQPKKSKFLEKNLLLHIQGGIGKCVMATAVIRSYKTAHPQSKVVVVSGYPEIFVNNPDVHKNFPFATPNLWQDYYSQPGWHVSAQDPYFENSWIKNDKFHLITLWCCMLGVESVQTTPLMWFSGPEVDELNVMIKTDKPLLVVQSTGGGNAAARSWTRTPPHGEFDAHLGQYLDSHFVAHLCVPETPPLSNVHQRVETLNRRQAACLVHFAQAFVGIDSFGMHARAANPMSGPTTIFFPLAESVVRLGYTREGWTNIVPVQAVQDLLANHQDFYANVFKFSIENAAENCPVPVGMKWFSV